MKDETKEILDWLSDDDIYVEDYGYQYKRISLRESKLLLDYITNLHEENKKLSKEIKNIEKEDDEIRVKNSFLVNGFHELEIRIDKAIEYNKQKLEDIKEEIITVTIYDKEYEKYVKEILNNNLNILQGEDKDE